MVFVAIVVLLRFKSRPSSINYLESGWCSLDSVVYPGYFRTGGVPDCYATGILELFGYTPDGIVIAVAPQNMLDGCYVLAASSLKKHVDLVDL
jgi:hypothetical protein